MWWERSKVKGYNLSPVVKFGCKSTNSPLGTQSHNKLGERSRKNRRSVLVDRRSANTRSRRSRRRRYLDLWGHHGSEVALVEGGCLPAPSAWRESALYVSERSNDTAELAGRRRVQGDQSFMTTYLRVRPEPGPLSQTPPLQTHTHTQR